MSAFFEIAYAAASNRLCLFTGTGFSKAVTENTAPSWQGLLERMCDGLPDPAGIKTALFPAGSNSLLSLEEAAQVISIELAKSGKNLHEEIAHYIQSLKPSGDNKVIAEFLQRHTLRIVTTNYDKLAEKFAESGTPISRPKSSERTNPWRRQPPVFNLFHQPPLAVADHARFF